MTTTEINTTIKKDENKDDNENSSQRILSESYNRPCSLLWKFVTKAGIRTFFENSFHSSEIKKLLSKNLSLSLENEEKSTKDLVLLDLYYYLIMFCIRRKYSLEKTSVALAIMVTVHKQSMTEVLSIDSSYQRFKDLLIQHSIDRPPWSVQILTLKEYQELSTYITNTYYRFYKFYHAVFAEKQQMDLNFTDQVANPPEIPPTSSTLSSESFPTPLSLGGIKKKETTETEDENQHNEEDQGNNQEENKEPEKEQKNEEKKKKGNKTKEKK